MKKIAVIGHFADGKNYLDGQTVKTKIVTKALCDHYGEADVLMLDTYGWKRKPVRFLCQVYTSVKQAENVLILPAHNGLRVFVPVLRFAARCHKSCKLHYAVIGGWLPEFLQKRKGLAKQLKRFTGIYVETSTMKKALDAMGFENVAVMPNCKELPQLTEDQIVYPTQAPYKLCTFSRVMKEKGIEDAVAAVRAINEATGSTVYTLDIYGQIDPGQTEWFDALRETFPEYIRYGGLVPFDQSVAVLKDYFALLFPTKFFTEGIPGTIIDAYAAGVPVISAKWESFCDVVDDKKTGYGYEFGSTDAFEALLLQVARQPEMITGLKGSCLKKMQDYTPEKAVQILLERMEG